MHISSILRDLRFSTAVVLGLAGTASVALGEPGDLACALNQILTFSPPLKPGLTSSVSITGQLMSCISSNGAHSQLDSGTFTGDGGATATGGGDLCGSKIKVTYNSHVKWSTRTQSEIDATLNLSPDTDDVPFSGIVVAGPLKGDGVKIISDTKPNPDCTAAGLKTLHFSGQMVW